MVRIFSFFKTKHNHISQTFVVFSYLRVLTNLIWQWSLKTNTHSQTSWLFSLWLRKPLPLGKLQSALWWANYPTSTWLKCVCSLSCLLLNCQSSAVINVSNKISTNYQYQVLIEPVLYASYEFVPSWCTKHNVMISVSRSQPFLCRCGSISSQKEKGWWLILWFFFSSQKLVSCELLFTGLKGLLLVCELLLRNRCLLVSCLCFCLWEPHRDVFHFMLNCHLMLEFFVSKAFLLWNKAEKVQIGG